MFFSSFWGLPTYKYEAERIEPAKHSAWYLTLTISDFNVEKGNGHFEIVWIEGKKPRMHQYIDWELSDPLRQDS